MNDYIKEVFDKYSKVVTITTTVVSLLWGVMHYFDQIQKNQSSIAQLTERISTQEDRIRSMELKIVELNTKLEVTARNCSYESK